MYVDRSQLVHAYRHTNGYIMLYVVCYACVRMCCRGAPFSPTILYIDRFQDLKEVMRCEHVDTKAVIREEGELTRQELKNQLKGN